MKLKFMSKFKDENNIYLFYNKQKLNSDYGICIIVPHLWCRFHELGEFDEMKRSCRRRLAGHNERRRKSSMNESQEGSSRKGMKGSEVKEIGCGGEVDERGRMHMSIQENAGYEHFQIR